MYVHIISLSEMRWPVPGHFSISEHQIYFPGKANDQHHSGEVFLCPYLREYFYFNYSPNQFKSILFRYIHLRLIDVMMRQKVSPMNFDRHSNISIKKTSQLLWSTLMPNWEREAEMNLLDHTYLVYETMEMKGSIHLQE